MGLELWTYKDYKNFCNADFRHDILQETSFHEHLSLMAFKGTVTLVLNRHAPLKKGYIQANQTPFMNKVLRKAVMARSRLRNKY